MLVGWHLSNQQAIDVMTLKLEGKRTKPKTRIILGGVLHAGSLPRRLHFHEHSALTTRLVQSRMRKQLRYLLRL